MIRTSVTFPNMPKYSRNFSLEVCQERPPTNNLPGAGSEDVVVADVTVPPVPVPPLGVDLPDDPEWLPPIFIENHLSIHLKFTLQQNNIHKILELEKEIVKNFIYHI